MMGVKAEPREEVEPPTTGDQEEESGEGDQSVEAAVVMTPAQSQQHISDVVHEIMSSGSTIAEIEVKLREFITKETSKAQTNLEVLNESTTEQYDRKCDERNSSWAQQFERHRRTTTQMIEAELNSRGLYWRTTVDELRVKVLMTTESLAHSTSVATQVCTALDSTQRRLMTFEQVCGMGVSFAEETLILTLE